MPKRPKVYLFDHSPHLRGEWDYEKNASENMETITIGASKKVWWLCSEKHSYIAAPKHRKQGTGCPVCAGKMVLLGYNDLGSVRPDLAAEWDYEKNTTKTPSSIVQFHNGSAWWVCPIGHSYSASVNNRAKLGRGCPYCSSQKLLAGYNDMGTTHPGIAAELDDPVYSPTEVFAHTHKKLQWVCAENHRWVAAAYLRAAGNGCPVCSNYSVLSGYNDIKSLRPDMYNELEDKTLGTQLSPGSGKKVRWVCAKGHKWDAVISSRASGCGCPVCTNITIVPGSNDLRSVNPRLYEELVDKSLGTVLSPSSKSKVWWVCSKGHEWHATVNSRASKLTDCPKCSQKQTSKVEGRLRKFMGEVGEVLSDDHTYRLPVPYRRNKTMSVDIFVDVPQNGLVCEYDGYYYHQTPESTVRDTEKTAALLETGYYVVRIRESPLGLLDMHNTRLLQISVPYSLKDDNLIRAVDQIKQWLESKND